MATSATMGTLAYMAPEQIQGKPRPASDPAPHAITQQANPAVVAAEQERSHTLPEQIVLTPHLSSPLTPPVKLE